VQQRGHRDRRAHEHEDGGSHGLGDRRAHEGCLRRRYSQTGEYVEKISPGASPSALIAGVVFWLIFLFVLSAAIGALKIPAVTVFMNQVLSYLPNVIVAVLIFVIAGAIAGAAGGPRGQDDGRHADRQDRRHGGPGADHDHRRIHDPHPAPHRSGDRGGDLHRTHRLRRPGAALAFGLGGRELAGDALRQARDKGQEQKGQVKQDMQTGKERGQGLAEQGKDKAQTQVQSGGDSGSSSGSSGAISERRFRD